MVVVDLVALEAEAEEVVQADLVALEDRVDLVDQQDLSVEEDMVDKVEVKDMVDIMVLKVSRVMLDLDQMLEDGIIKQER